MAADDVTAVTELLQPSSVVGCRKVGVSYRTADSRFPFLLFAKVADVQLYSYERRTTQLCLLDVIETKKFTTLYTSRPVPHLLFLPLSR